MLTPFHLAFPVTDLAATRSFYEQRLGCAIGRTHDRWIDFDLFGHQVTAHLVDRALESPTNRVDKHDVPAFHFGVVLDWNDWHSLAERLRAAGTQFSIEPTIRFAGEVGEQATMFFQDPSGNHLEFKSFKDPAKLFAT